MLKKYQYLANFIYHAARSQGGVNGLIRKAWAIYRVEGYGGILRRLPLRRSKAFVAEKFLKNTYLASELVNGDLIDLRPSGGIVIVAHIYYFELFDEIASALENIPWSFDCFISVNDEHVIGLIKDRISKIKNIGKFDIRVVPNRGRDISPLLVEFSKEIRRYQYVLHVHTKKSLYSGRERVEWREYLLESLLGSERRIRHIFHQFVNNPNIGIIYPDTFEGVPYWAHTWLQNRSIAFTLGNRLGIDIEYCNYVDAPMGSMFWCRVAALSPLLDLNLSYSDFPEECGQIDGTLQHTIERFFVPVANHVGFSQRTMLSAEDNATLFISPGRKNLFHYYALEAKSKILLAAKGKDIVSFDIFDTLLIRQWLFPNNVFAYLDEKIKIKFGLDNFANLRKQAEHLARLNKVGDVSLEEIYTELGKLLGRPELINIMREAEETTELIALKPRLEVIEAAQRIKEEGKRIVLISDMYLPKKLIRKALSKYKIDFFDAIYLSSEIGLRKDRGDLWEVIAQKEKIVPSKWLHVGDNEHSDLQLPLNYGYTHPVHVMRASDQFFLFNEEARYWIRPNIWQEGLLLGLLANRVFIPGCAHAPILIDANKRSIEINSLRDLGYLAIGPTLSVFMAWLFEQADSDKIELLLYTSREGYLLKQAHDLIATYRSIPNGQYFLSSRRIALIASLRDDSSSINALLKAHFSGSFADFLQKRLGIEDTSPFFERLGAERMNRYCTLPENSLVCRQQILECLDILMNEAENERLLYTRYTSSIIDGKRAALVDIGYSATIQRALATFMQDIVGGYYFITVEQSAEIERFNQFAKGCFGHRINAFHSDIPIYQFSLLLEAVMSAPHGQLLGFKEKNGEVLPRFKAPGLSQKYFSEIEEIHKGALEYLNDVLEISGDLFIKLGKHHGAANLSVRQLMEYRWKLGVDSSALHVEDNYSGNDEISIFEFYDKKRERFPGLLG